MENSRSIEPTFHPVASLAAVHGTAKKMRLQMANGSFLTHQQTTLLLPLSKHGGIKETRLRTGSLLLFPVSFLSRCLFRRRTKATSVFKATAKPSAHPVPNDDIEDGPFALAIATRIRRVRRSTAKPESKPRSKFYPSEGTNRGINK